ncbi:acyltransferase [Daejeonella sp. JGW-45]|uniref:acyltransferase family protein n=1 Tax=Daejeonella sp. JGW-45 TaxID=3034148 RepID=UPI0023EDEE74|nr:acyltransferase [Daejeonella sp. JGW-45]
MNESMVVPKYGYLNALRGIAIILVVILHVSQTVEALPPAVFKLLERGSYGVQLFFIASAYTIFLSYARRSQIEGEYLIKNFFIRRFFRIAPLYYLAAIFYTIFYYYHPDGFQEPVNVLKVIPSVLFINGFFPGAINYIPPGGWSVGVEMAFYCTVPFLFQKVDSLKRAIRLFALLFLATMVIKFALRFLMIYFLDMNYLSMEGWTLYFWFPNQIVIFSFGIILYFLVPKFTLKKQWLGGIYLLFLFALLILLFILKDKYDSYHVIPEHVLAAAIFSVVFLIMSKAKVKLLNNQVTRFLGEISFSLYLVHFVIVYFTDKLLLGFTNPYVELMTKLVIVLFCGAMICYLTYTGIEKRGIALGNRIINRRMNEQ